MASICKVLYLSAYIKASPLFVFGGSAPSLPPSPLLASLHPSLPPGSASPSPTRWPSLWVKAVSPALLARQNVVVAEPVRTDTRDNRPEHVHTQNTGGNLFCCSKRVALVSLICCLMVIMEGLGMSMCRLASCFFSLAFSFSSVSFQLSSAVATVGGTSGAKAKRASSK